MRGKGFSYLILAAVWAVAASGAAQSSGRSSEVFLHPRVRVGQTLSNVFSRTIAYKATGIDDVVRRTSGTADYVASEVTSDRLVFAATVLYDGRPEAKGRTEFRDLGRISCWDEQCATNTDASGLLYNPALWGEPKGNLREGMRWTVELKAPWELGPAGRQTVTVVAVDRAGHSVTLKREGEGEGFLAEEKKQIQITRDGKTYLADVTPGRAHWTGLATIREGVVISDELLVRRELTLTTKDLGAIAATQRQYILLNNMPAECASCAV